MESKEVKIQKPFNIMQVGKWMRLQQRVDEIDKDEYEAEVVSIFSNITKKEAFEVIDYGTFQKAYYAILAELASYHSDRPEPRRKIKVDGVTYTYEGDLTKLTVAMRMDILMMKENVFDMPNKLMSILYQSDKKTPKEAEAIFAERFPVNEFMIAWRFFFLKFQRWRSAIQAIQEARMDELKNIKRLMKMEQRLVSATKLRRPFILWQIFLIEMWIKFKAWCMLPFYTGKTFGKRSINWIRRGLSFKR